MIIKPPNDYGIPEPKLLEVKVVDRDKDWEENRRIQLYLDIKPWVCSVCGQTMFGRVLACVGCKQKGLHTPRPANFKREKRDE